MKNLLLMIIMLSCENIIFSSEIELQNIARADQSHQQKKKISSAKEPEKSDGKESDPYKANQDNKNKQFRVIKILSSQTK